MSVMDAEENSEKTIQRLIEQGREAIKRGAEVLILGCAGMTGYHEPVSKALGVPVLDPVEVTFLQLEMLAGVKLKLPKQDFIKLLMLRR